LKDPTAGPHIGRLLDHFGCSRRIESIPRKQNSQGRRMEEEILDFMHRKDEHSVFSLKCHYGGVRLKVAVDYSSQTDSNFRLFRE
jgi:hypothetical protein